LYGLQRRLIMTLSTLLTYCLALFVAAAIPGPGMTALVARALGAGLAEGAGMALGLMLGDMIFLTAVVLGLSVVAQTFGAVFMAIKYLGVVYLVYVAYRIWTAGLFKTEIGAEAKRSVAQAFASGLFVTLGNPKTMLFYIALVPTLVDLQSLKLADYGLLLLATFIVLGAVTMPYILLASKAREAFRHPKALGRLNKAAAGCLVATAGYIATRAN